MNVRFYIDPTTEQPHIYNHNVTEREVEELLAQPGEDTGPGKKDRELRSAGRPRDGIYA